MINDYLMINITHERYLDLFVGESVHYQLCYNWVQLGHMYSFYNDSLLQVDECINKTDITRYYGNPSNTG